MAGIKRQSWLGAAISLYSTAIDIIYRIILFAINLPIRFLSLFLSKHKIPERLVTVIFYLLFLANIILTARKLYSVELAIIIYLFATLVFLVRGIDGRFMLFPALLLLAYCPFLLIGKQDTTAELIAVHAYYFLLFGVVIQLIELRLKREPALDFGAIFREVMAAKPFLAPAAALAIASVVLWLLPLFSAPRFIFARYTLLYLLCISIIFHLISVALMNGWISGERQPGN